MRKHHHLASGRPSVKGKSRKGPKKYTHIFTDYSFKWLVVQEYIKNGLGVAGLSSAMSKYFPDMSEKREASTKKKIQAWFRNRNSIEKKAKKPSSAKKMSNRRIGQATVLDIETEKRIADWDVGHRLDGVPVSNILLQQYALQ
ncbi:hypothetical protein LEN26_005103, partial [Aphanomyces euteiches]